MTTLTSLFIYTNDGSTSNTMRLFWLVFYMCMVVVNLLLYQYLQELENKQCDCAKKHRKALQYAIAVKVFFMVMETIALAVSPQSLALASGFYIIASTISTMVHFPLALLFLLNSSEESCGCARDWKEWMFYMSLF